MSRFKRIAERRGRVRAGLVELLLQIGNLGLAHRFAELVLEIGRHPANLAHPMADPAQHAGQFLRPDGDQRDHSYDEKLAPA